MNLVFRTRGDAHIYLLHRRGPLDPHPTDPVSNVLDHENTAVHVCTPILRIHLALVTLSGSFVCVLLHPGTFRGF